MRSKLTFTFLALCLVFATGAAFAAQPATAPAAPEAPACSSAAADLPVVADQDQSDDGAPASLEDLLSTSPENPVTRAIDSGICCTSSSQCPSVSGYAKRCSSGSCTSAYSCLYRRL